MKTEIRNNGTFTVRTREYQTDKGRVVCTMQHGIGFSKEYKTIRWSFYPKGIPVGYGNLSKKGMKYRTYK
jgi:hypothetical protein